MEYDAIIVGGGFTGLSAAYEMLLRGKRPVVVEQDAEPGGLAGSFDLDGVRLEKFYHHWFTNDLEVQQLIGELEMESKVIPRPTRTGFYHNNTAYRLSGPLDVMKFRALTVPDRVRLGLLALRARKVKDWRTLEKLTAAEWLRQMGGEQVFSTVWEPLLRGKFGPYADEISAVWFWNKLKLRGGSRDKKGAEILLYFQGGFAALAEGLANRIRILGGDIRLSSQVRDLNLENGRVIGVELEDGKLTSDVVLSTVPLPALADLIDRSGGSSEYSRQLRRIDHLANVCLVLVLDRSLSSTYWLNVGDPTFPFVGIIEHTNFEPPETYSGKHIVYLSKYLPASDALFQMSDEELLCYTIPFIKRMFPEFEPQWILRSFAWRAQYSQPVVVRDYGALVPSFESPIPGLFLSTMAQIYPEDRGTNYAIREGRKAGAVLAGLAGPP